MVSKILSSTLLMFWTTKMRTKSLTKLENICANKILVSKEKKEKIVSFKEFAVFNLCFNGMAFYAGVLAFRHLLLKTGPGGKQFVFTIKAHPSLTPGTIGFSAPQVTCM